MPLVAEQLGLNTKHLNTLWKDRALVELNVAVLESFSRVGGLTESKRIHDLCEQAGIPLWCGGMLESGIGRAHNIAIASLANFTLPGDTASSSRYWEKDIIVPEDEEWLDLNVSCLAIVRSVRLLQSHS